MAKWIWRSAIVAAAILAVLISITACVLGGLAYSNLNQFNEPRLLFASGIIQPSPYVVHLAQAAAPMQVEIFEKHLGAIYRILSLTNQPHTVKLIGATWDGTNSNAVFGGSVGDGIVYEFISSSRVVVYNALNVVFN